MRTRRVDDRFYIEPDTSDMEELLCHLAEQGMFIEIVSTNSTT